MTATTAAGRRIVSLDLLRGLAVMGILAMNIVAFAMPFQAYLNPVAYGGSEGVDLWAWTLAFIFIDGKMRAMFSILFGASLLLVVDRAEATRPGSGAVVHYRRMAVLLGFGLAHFFLIWFGDILAAYAVSGMVLYLFVGKEQAGLLRSSLLFFALALIVYGLIFLSPLLLQAAASAPDASADTVAQWEALKSDLGRPSAEVISRDIAIHSGPWTGIVAYSVTERWGFLLQGVTMFLPETLALMLLGMWGLRSGFLTGGWEAARYAKVATICLGIGLPAYAGLAGAMVASDFDVGMSLALSGFATLFFRPLVTLGYAALVLLAVKRGFGGGELGTRIAAAGRAAFTNYLGTSLLMTFLFYGWGLGLYGTFGRAQVYLLVIPAWALMLLWSRPWLERYRYGPLEWTWRSLARGAPQPMRKAIA
jgi:uncharacterized protein